MAKKINRTASSRTRKRFKGKTESASYERRYLIAVEGTNTEKQYFERVIRPKVDANIQIDCIPASKDGDSSPLHVLQRMQTILPQRQKDPQWKKNGEAWLVIDRDRWSEEHISMLVAWAEEDAQHHLALSNPLFELWLLWHFEDTKKPVTSRDCKDKLQRYIKDSKKEIPARLFSESSIRDAIERAKKRDAGREKWPKGTGSTVYRLVEKLISKDEKA